MDSKVKILLGIIGVLFVGLVIWVVMNTPDEPPPITKIEPPKIMEYEGNTIIEEQNGVKLYELSAGKMIIDVETQNATFENLDGKFYQPSGRFFQLTAKKGNYNHQSGDIHVEGEVVVTDSEGAKLTGNELDFVGADQILIATGDVKIFKDDMRAYGDTAEAWNGLRHFKLKGNARIVKGVKDSEGE